MYLSELSTLSPGISYGVTKLVYNGSSESNTDRDSELLPYKKYQYSVTAVNNVGKVDSLWAEIDTKEAPPESVPAPNILVSNLYVTNIG